MRFVKISELGGTSCGRSCRAAGGGGAITLEMAEVVWPPQTGDCQGGHGGEVESDQVHTLGGERLAGTEVLLEVERVLRHPHGVSQVSSHPLQALHALRAGVGPGPLLPPTDSPSTADMLSPLDKEVVHHQLQHGDVVLH